MKKTPEFFGKSPVVIGGLLGGLLFVLSGCSEPERILPGEREDIHLDGAPDAGLAVPEGQRAISLVAQQRNASWAQGFGTEAFRTAHPALSSTPRLAWSVPIGQGDSRKQRINARPIVGGGRIYTLDAGNTVTAVSENGAVLWSVDLDTGGDDREQATGGGLSYEDGALYVSLGFGALYALDASTGATRWSQRLEATGSGQPTVSGGLVYVVAGDDTGWAVDARDGRIRWQINATPSVANFLGAPAPALTSDLAVFAFGSGDVVATFRKGGFQRWNASVSGQREGRAAARISDITGEPVVSGNKVYVGNQSGRLVGLDLATGERLWTTNEGPMDPVWPAGDSVFAVTDRQELVRVDSSNGQVIWRAELPGFTKTRRKQRGAVYAHYGPVLAGGRVIVASNDGVLRSYAPQDGRLISTVEIPDGATTPFSVANGTLYVVSTKGELHAFR